MIKAVMLGIVGLLTILKGSVYIAQEDSSNLDKTYTGYVYSKNQTMVATRMMGYIKKMYVEEGDVVKKGDKLFEVDISDIKSIINQAKAGLNQAKQGLMMAELAYADAKRDYDRFKNLYDQGAVPKRDYEKMKLNMEIKKRQVDLAKGMVEQAKAGLEQAYAQLKYGIVKSPISGIVVRKLKKVGEMALPGHPVVIISSLNSLRVKAFVKESDIDKLKVGQRATIHVDALNKDIEGYISSIIPSGDMATHSYLVKFKLKDTRGLLPGMYVKIRVHLGKANYVLIPYNALTSRNGVVGVFVGTDNNAVFRRVKIVRQMGDMVAVEGVHAGESVVEYPSATLKAGHTSIAPATHE